MKKLILSVASISVSLLLACGEEEKDKETTTAAAIAGDKTAYCQVEVVGTVSCTETRNTNQAFIDALAATCEDAEVDMTSGEGDCPNKGDAPGECVVVKEGQTTYIYQSGDAITVEIAQASCESAVEEGETREFTPKP